MACSMHILHDHLQQPALSVPEQPGLILDQSGHRCMGKFVRLGKISLVKRQRYDLLTFD